MSGDEPIRLEADPGAEPRMLRLESSNSTWLFDVDRMRFRRVPRGTDLDSPVPAAEWQPYFGLEVEPATGAFTVALNDDGTRRLRAIRVDAERSDDHTTELKTTEINLRPDSKPV